MHSLVQQQVRMLMAAPLQTKENVLGLIYVDSPFVTPRVHRGRPEPSYRAG